MFAHVFRFDSSRLHAAFAPRKPRHPLLRVLFGLVGLVLLALLLIFGVFVGAAMLAGGLVYRLWKQRGQRPHSDPQVVEGEYRVVDKPAIEGQLLSR